MTCPQCKLVKLVTYFPYRCQCGIVYWGDTTPPKPRQQPQRTFQTTLYDVIGCNCVPALPRKTLVSRLSKKLEISVEEATKLVNIATKLHEQLSSSSSHYRHS